MTNSPTPFVTRRGDARGPVRSASDRLRRREGEPPLAASLAPVADRVDLGAASTSRWRIGRTRPAPPTRGSSPGCWPCTGARGGELPAVLDQVAATLRERSAAAREVRALTAQARLSGAILGLLPIGFFLFLWVTSRDDIEAAFHSPAGSPPIALGFNARASRSCGSDPCCGCEP